MAESDRPDAPESPSVSSPADELKAALGHLKSAAGLLVGRIQKDEGLRKAAHEAESALEKAATNVEHAAEVAAAEAERAVKQLGERSKPLVKELGSEFSRLARNMRAVLEPEPIPSDEAEGGSDASTGAPNVVQASERDGPKKTEDEAKRDETS
jgi:hypothetical protein